MLNPARPEPIPGAPDGLDITGIRRVLLQFLPQSAAIRFAMKNVENSHWLCTTSGHQSSSSRIYFPETAVRSLASG